MVYSVTLGTGRARSSYEGESHPLAEQLKLRLFSTLLNEKEDLSTAMVYINEILIHKYNWKTSSKHYKKFLDLIERRYMKW